MIDRSISLLYTTARPHLTNDVVYRWMSDQDNLIEMVIVTDDPVEHTLDHANVRHVHNGGRRDSVTGWNLAAQHSKNDILIVVSDDLFPPSNWHTIIRHAVDNCSQVRHNVVLNLLDERQVTNAVFHPVLTRAAYLTASYIYPPDFKSMYCDNWFCEYHQKYSNYYTSRNVFWHHRHRTTHPVAIDDVMRAHESPARYEEGKETLLKYRHEHLL